MAEMIYGLGQALFAMIVTAAIAMLLAMVGSYLSQNNAVYICIGCFTLPFIVFGIYASAPRPDPVDPPPPPGAPIPVDLYKEQKMDAGNIIDYYYPVRVSLIILLGLGIVYGIVHKLIVQTLKAPPFVAPKIRCRREQIESLHPLWYK